MNVINQLTQVPLLWAIFSPQVIIPLFFLIYFGVVYQLWKVKEQKPSNFEFYGGNFEQLSERQKKQVLKNREKDSQIIKQLRSENKIGSHLKEVKNPSPLTAEIPKEIEEEQKVLELFLNHKTDIHPELYHSLSKQNETNKLTS